ncbi:MAG: polysaccharide pyruvyl transferase family protein [Candidatus Paceibacterota bacterium]
MRTSNITEPRPRVFVLNDTRRNYHHGSSRVMENLFAILSEYGALLTGTVANTCDWRSSQTAKDQIRRSDWVIINGEGTMHHGKKAIDRMLSIAEEFDVKCALVNSIWQSNTHAQAERLRRFRFVQVRDLRSQSELRDVGIDACYAPDLTFYRTSDSIRASLSPACIGITDSVYPDVTAKLLETCSSQNIRPWVYLPMTIPVTEHGDHKATKRLIRNWFSQRFKKMHPKTLQVTSPADYLGLLRSCDAVITGRFHALCFCIQCEIPFRCIQSNSHKIQSLLGDVGLDFGRFMIAPKDAADLLASGDTQWRFDESEIEKIRQFNRTATDRIKLSYQPIADEK